VIIRCELMICNDNGAMHIADAVQTSVFAIIGPTVQLIGYYPYRNEDRVFEVELYCHPMADTGVINAHWDIITARGG